MSICAQLIGLRRHFSALWRRHVPDGIHTAAVCRVDELQFVILLWPRHIRAVSFARLLLLDVR
jgi:hypothetical protein